MASARAVEANLVFDGCLTGCGSTIFNNLGIPFRHFVMTDYGAQKGKTEITAELIDATVRSAAEEIVGADS